MKRALLLGFLVVFLSCKDTKNSQSEIVKIEKEIQQSYTVKGDELLLNPKFKNWVTNAKPKGWEINEKVSVPEEYIVDRDTLDLLLKGKKDDVIYILQNLQLTEHTTYVLSLNIGTNLKSNSYSGVLLKDQKGLIGKRIFKKTADRAYNVIFKTRSNSSISVYVGYIKKGEGRIRLKNISLKEVDINSEIYESKIAQIINDNLSLSLVDEKSFNTSISKIIRHTSDLILSDKRKDSSNIVLKNILDSKLKENSYLKKYFNEASGSITKSYATKLVYSSLEMLEEFNIGTRKIELIKGNKRIHQLLEYFNPYSNDWITIDPFYNAKILTSSLSQINEEEIGYEDLGGLSKNVEGLISRYVGSEKIIKKEKIIGYPY